MTDGQTKPPFGKKSIIPKKYDWNTLVSKAGNDLEDHYRHALENLTKESWVAGRDL